MSARKLYQIGAPVAVVLLILTVWQAAVQLGNIDKWFLPGPVDIVKEGIASFPRVMEHTKASLGIALTGFALSIAVGFAAAVLLHLFQGFREAIYPLLIISQNIPILTLGPLLVVWLGFGVLPKIVLIVLMLFFPITVSTLSGLMQADRSMLGYMRMIGATRRHIFMKLELPGAMPHIFSGLKISATYSIMGAVIAEWLGASKGIGLYMKLSQTSFRADRVFVAVFVIVALSLTVFGLIVWIESRVIRWKTMQRSDLS